MHETEFVEMLRGLKQGSIESAILFAGVINWVLSELHESWKQRGLGFRLGKWGGNSLAFAEWLRKHRDHFVASDIQDLIVTCLAFMDDILLLASSVKDLQTMIDEVVQKLSDIGLAVNVKKTAWMTDKLSYASCNTNILRVGGKPIGLSTCLEVLGSMITMDNSAACAAEHRFVAGWKCFHKWKHVLTSSASLDNKLDFFKRTVVRSLMWALASCKSNKDATQKLASAMHQMVRQMMRLKRQPLVDASSNVVALEPWLDWHKRSLDRAKKELETRSLSTQHCLDAEKHAWAGHVARFGTDGKNKHLCKNIVCWRPVAWWRDQQMFNFLNWDCLKHPFPFLPNRWDEDLEPNWILSYQRTI